MKCSEIKSLIIAGVIGVAITGCMPTENAAPMEIKTEKAQAIVPYLPTTQQIESVENELPTSPRDAAPAVNLIYSIEIWEVFFPRNTVSSDEDFWKRVNESAIDLGPHDVMFKNGIRIGELPVSDIDYLQKLVADKKGQQTRFTGIAGKQIDLMITPDIDRQTIFYFDRENKLVGRTYDKSANLIYFAFETTPRKPGLIRLALTPAVKALNTRLQYTQQPGKSDREITYINDEFHYDANLTLDLPVTSILVLAPSVEARDKCTLGHTYFVKNTPAEQLDRMIFIVPRAFKRDASQ